MSESTKKQISRLHPNGLYWYGVVPSSLENYEHLQLIMKEKGSVTIPIKSGKLKEYLTNANRKVKNGRTLFYQVYLKINENGEVLLYKNNENQWNINEYAYTGSIEPLFLR